VETLEGNVKFIVQGYAYDVFFISECPDEISQMPQVLDEFTE
jgi:hypothetical protein